MGKDHSKKQMMLTLKSAGGWGSGHSRMTKTLREGEGGGGGITA